MSEEKKPRPRIQDGPATPAKVFDDVFYVGRVVVGVFIIKTSEGLVMIDSMDPVDADEKHILPGMEALGLDPKELKLIIITHGHFDHFAGAKRLQDKFGCKVALGQIDSAFMVTGEYPKERHPVMEYPRIDMVLEDRKPIVVGDHTFIPVLTPGHTPGGMSLMFNVHDGGQEHWASLWVGSGLPRPVFYWEDSMNGVATQLRYTCAFAHSIYVFNEACEKQGCDVILGVHPHRCDLFPKLEKLAARQSGEAHPFVVGAEAVKENLKQMAHNALDQAARIIDEM